MAVESSVGPLLNEQRQQLAQELSIAAQSLNRAAIAAERLARTLTDVDFAASPYEQQTQYMAALSATKDLHTTFSAEPSSQKRKRGGKVAKDPDAPKKPITAYLIFQEAKRKELTEQHPGSPYKEILKRLGHIWKNMSDAEKEPYTRAHAKAIAQHGAEMAAYEKNKGISATAEKPKENKSTKLKNQKPAPKPKSGAAASKATGTPVAEESGSESDSSESASTEAEEGSEDESEAASPPPKKPKVAAKPPTPVKTLKKEPKTKEKK